LPERPNILWICTDQQRYDTIGALGNSYVSTPNIDKLVESGTAFTHAYCQSPICTPSRASFLTGRYPSAVHVNGNGNARFPEHPPLITKILSDAGYDCGLVGKLHLSSAFGRIEERVDDGYRYWKYSHAPRDDWEKGHDYADWVGSKGKVLGELTKSSEGVPAKFHQTTWCAEKTIDFIKEERDDATPWLVSVNIYDPHPPFNPPQEYRDQFSPEDMPGALFRESDLSQQEKLAPLDFQSKGRDPEDLDIRSPIVPRAATRGLVEAPGPGGRDHRTLQAAYYAMIKLVDDQVGRMMDALKETGQLENTLVIFMSDHGETLGDHGLIQKGCRFYEGLVRVPLILSWPSKVKPGTVCDGLTELHDVTATIMEAAGQDIPGYFHGRSLLPIATGVSDDDSVRDFVRCEYYDALDLADGTLATMYRDGSHKLAVYHGHGFGELYDLENDPDEFDNLWDDPDHQAVKMELMHKSFDATMMAIDKGSKRIGPM
jgi:arylsulfatase A-like enzyme